MRGSEWKKWNIHVHTKGTNKADQFTSASMDDFFFLFFKKALEENVSAIAITDYFSIDNYKAALKYVEDLEHKVDDAGNPLFTKAEVGVIKGIFLLPNVELRMMPATDAGRLINIHCLFNPDYVSELENDFFNTLTNQDGKQMNRAGIISYGKTQLGGELDDEVFYKMGIERFVIEISSLKKILDSNPAFKNNTIIIVSNSNKDGASGLQQHYDLFETESGALDGVRKTIYEISNAIFSGNPKDKDYFLGKRLDSRPYTTEDQKNEERQQVLNDRGSFKACFVGCDAHSEDQLFIRFTWVKGALNFNGLKQIMFEPEQRVKIQDQEPDQKDEKLIIDNVQFKSSDNLFTAEPIYFNRNLNVIIGGKSSGKSILLYNIAKTLLPDRNTLKSNENNGRYKYSFPDDFNFEVTIGSGHKQDINRTDDTSSILPEIKYIPQNYLFKLVEPENKKGNELVGLIRGLLLEDETYSEKYMEFKARLKSNDLKRDLAINSYFELKEKIQSQKSELKQKGNKTVLTDTVEVNQGKIAKLKENAGLDEAQIEQYNKLSTESSDIEGSLKKLRNDYSKVSAFNEDLANILTDLIQKRNLVLGSLENVDVISFFQEQYQIIDNALTKVQEISESIIGGEESQFKNANIFTELSTPFTERQLKTKYLLEPFVQNQLIKSEIETLEKVINGDLQSLSSIKQTEIEIEKNETVLKDEKGKLFSMYKDNFLEYSKIIDAISDRSKLLKNDRLDINGIPKFNFPKFRGSMLGLIDGRKANYSNYPLLVDNKTGISDFKFEEILSDLKKMFDSMVESNDFPFLSKVDLKTAVKNLLEDYFFDYWDAVYDNDKLFEMSAGKASFVILMLIVGLSKSKAPILIDQPEDNLDNRSISKDLVEYLRNKKLERQIILVTHNANVVVNADAENVIVANQKGQNDKETTSIYQFDYVNGPIEDTKPIDKNITDLLKSMGIREHITDIVEGGEEAFKKREKKYGFAK